MGSGIAVAAATAGLHVLLHDPIPQALEKSRERIAALLMKTPEVKSAPGHTPEPAHSRISYNTSLAMIAGADLVIEAAVEDLSAKRDLFQRLDALFPPRVILATNTSSLSVTAIASAASHAERVAGMHFFNPAHRMQLVEVVRGHRTSNETVEGAVAAAHALGKTPVLVKDTPGFIVNRVARPFYGEALRLLGDGVATVEQIDRIVKVLGGFKMGPFELMDLIGIDVNLAVTKSIYEQTFHEPRYRPHQIQQSMVSAGLLGRKSGAGFYTYKK